MTAATVWFDAGENVCVACGQPTRWHFGRDNRWVGCHGAHELTEGDMDIPVYSATGDFDIVRPWRELEPQHQPLMAECDEAYKALIQTRSAALLGKVEDVRDSYARLEDALTGLKTVLGEMFPDRES